jgi:hypothetical protein
MQAQASSVTYRYTLDRPRMKCVADDKDREDTKLLLLEAGIDIESGRHCALHSNQVIASVGNCLQLIAHRPSCCAQSSGQGQGP